MRRSKDRSNKLTNSHSVQTMSTSKRSTIAAPPPNTRPYLITFPSHITHQILSYLPSIDLNLLTSTSKSFRHLVADYIFHQHQRSLAHIYHLQSKVIAANLPNELLVGVLSYLSPIDFYNATRVCSAWRQAGSYRGLVRKNVYQAQPRNTQPPEGDLDGELKTLAFYLQASGQLNGNLYGRCTKHTVSTLYLKQHAPTTIEQQIRGSTVENYPQIHLSEDGHYFLAAERVHPWRVHVYCTYRTVLSDDASKLSNRNPKSFHEWDMTPTYLLTLPETGRVVSASFGPAICGGIEYNKEIGSYSKGLDLLVLLEGAQARLYKIRAANGGTVVGKNDNTKHKSFGKRLFGWTRAAKSHVEQNISLDPKWTIWDSMVFSNILFSREGPVTAKLGDRSEKVMFATAGYLEVWSRVNQIKTGDVWDKGAVVKVFFSIPKMPGMVSQVLSGKIWHNGLGADVEYTICSSTTNAATGTPAGPQVTKTSSTVPVGPQTKETDAGEACTAIIGPAESFKFNCSNLIQCRGYIGPSLYLGLTHQHTLSQIQLIPTLNTSHINTSYQPYSFIARSELALPSIPRFSKVAHIAAICTPKRSTHPVVAVATDSGEIFISVPPLCIVDPRPCFYVKICPSSSASLKRLACIPPETGGRITGLKVSFRGPVWDFPHRTTLHSNDARPGKDGDGMLVVVVATDRGRVEVCYFDSNESRLEHLGAGRRWDLNGSIVSQRMVLG